MPRAEQHLGFLDYFRGIAIILVFALHALVASYGTDHLAWSGWFLDFQHAARSFLFLLPADFGWAGVPIFFVVSGFCIHLSHERSKTKSFKVFFARRFFRIYPPYFIALMFFALVFPWTRFGLHSRYDYAQLGSHLLLMHNFSHLSYYGINGAFWSIAVEAQLYLIYPLLLLLAGRWGWRRALALTCVIEMTLRTASGGFDNLPQWFTDSPFSYWFCWSIGALLADEFLKGRPLTLRKCPLWVWPGITMICYSIKPLTAFCFPAAAMVAANVIARIATQESPAAPGGLGGVLSGHIKWVGTISYSVYLLHQPFLKLVPVLYSKLFPGHADFFHHPSIIFIGCILLVWPLVLILSYSFHRWVEQPSISLGKWFVRTRFPQPVALAALPTPSVVLPG